MELNEITGIVQAYREILLEEYNAICVLASYDGTVESHKLDALLAAYEAGTINDKNAETRKMQAYDVLASDEAYQFALDERLNVSNKQRQLEIERKCVEARISLVKAWLYSQSNTEAI